MTDANDMELVREYGCKQSDSAFEKIVSRHIGLVYSVALRRSGNPAHAGEITQTVFVILARKAARLPASTILVAWLHETTRLAAASFLRGEFRRQRREQEAYMQSTLGESAPDPWQQLAPLLDEAIGQLGDKDRSAVVLRFFQNKSSREIAAVLHVDESAAQKRLNRAVEKLRAYFLKRGVAVSAGVLMGVISANSVQGAPLHLTASVLAASTKGAVGGANLTLIKGVLKLMAWTKVQTAIVVGVGLVLAAGTATITVKEVSHYRQETVWDQITPSTDTGSQVSQDWQQLQKARPAVSIRPTKFDSSMFNIIGGYGKTMGIYRPFSEVLARAYDTAPSCIVPLTPLPRGNFDFIVSGSQPTNALQMKIESQYGLVGHRETREMDVLLLRVRQPNAPGLKPAAMPNGPSTSFWDVGHLRRANAPIRYIATDIQQYLQIPVVDQTGLTGRYDYDIKWDDELKWDDAGQWYYANTNGLEQAFLDQLGLELVPGREPVEALVVEKK